MGKLTVPTPFNMNKLIRVASERSTGRAGIEFDDIPICTAHFARMTGSLISELGMTDDTCKHCSIEWSAQWKSLLADNEWFGQVQDGDLIYISGPMTGWPEHNHPAFIRMEHALKLRGAKVISPIYHDEPGADYHALLKTAVIKMLNASKMVMLRNWYQSNGAILEHIIGRKLNYTIYYEAPHIVGISDLGLPFDRTASIALAAKFDKTI